MTGPPASHERLGKALVATQLALIATLAVLALPPFLQGRAPLGAWGLAVASALLGLWALAHNRPGNFNIRPMPREGGRLVCTGPYRWIRHPMYTAVIACGAACAWAAGSGWGWLAAAALAVVLAVKAVLEERWMLQWHPGYPAYCKGTRRFLPLVV